MAGATAPRAGATTLKKAPDWGGKAILVCVLAVLMAIPLGFVFLLVHEREDRAQGVTEQVSQLQGGSQQLLGPMLIAPYTTPPPPKQPGDTGPAPQLVTGWYVVSPDQGSVKVTVHGSSLHRSIFDVPVYEANADMDASFAPLPTSINLPAGSTVDWSRSMVVMGFSDLRGAKSDLVGQVTTAAGQSSLVFSPASGLSLGAPGVPPVAADTPASGRAQAPSSAGYGLVAAPAGALAAGKGGQLHIALKFTGAQRLGLLPFAKSTVLKVAGDWPAPSFDGGFLPDPPQLSATGFAANWNVPFIARGLSADGPADDLSLSALGGKDLGVSFIPANNPYKNVERSLKYAVMFVGLVFLTFFVFETLSGRRVHAAQYVLVGLAQMVFYLLLLSAAEYIGFDLAFAAAATATVLLIGLYAGAALKSRKIGAQALGIFTLLYGLIYLLMRLEDFALLAGSAAAFLGLALAMFLTRNLDWYGAKPEPAAAPAPPEPGPDTSAASTA